MFIEIILKLLLWCLKLAGYLAYYSLKELWLFAKYVYHKLMQSRPRVSTLLRRDNDTNDLGALE